MNQRILSTNLELLQGPKQKIKFLNSCDIQQSICQNKLVNCILVLRDFDFDLPNRTLYLVVSVENESNEFGEYPKPYYLFCADKQTRYTNLTVNDDDNCYCVPFDTKSMTSELKNFQIVKKNPKELTNLAEKHTICSIQKENQAINLETFSSQSKAIQEILLSQQKKCRLKFQVRIFNDLEKKFEHFLTEPIYSEVIKDSYDLSNEHVDTYSSPTQFLNTDITNLDNIRILRTSRAQGSINGGEEMFLFTTYFDPNDLLVEFFQLNKNGDVNWKSYAKFNKLDSHVNFAFVIQTPKYDSDNLDKDKNEKIRVYFRLFRPGRKDYSEKWTFFYINDNKNSPRAVDQLPEDKIEPQSGNKRKIEENEFDCKFKETNDKKNKILKGEIDHVNSDKKVNLNTNENKVNIDNESGSLLEKEKKDKMNINNSPKAASQIEILDNQPRIDANQYTLQLHSYSTKMNKLADRTGQSLLKFAKNRSLHDLLKTQRFLMNYVDEDGNTPLHLSIKYGNFDLLAIFVDVILTIPHQNIINCRNKTGFTPLLMAANLEEVELCEFLLEANADLSMADFDGNNPIHIACNRNSIGLLKVLTKYVDKQYNYSVLNSINHNGYAPIHLCAMRESYEMVRELLYFKELRINMPDKKLGYSALHYSVVSLSSFKIAQLMVKNEKIDVNRKSHNGCTPLHLAVANRNYLGTVLLMRNGADPNIQNDVPIHMDYDSMQYCLIRDMKAIEEHLKKQTYLTKENENVVDKVGDAAELTKLSVEVKRIFESHLNSCYEMGSKSKTLHHNHDPLAYAESDPWMKEILSNHKNLSKKLLLNIGCLEKIRKEVLENKISMTDVDQSKTRMAADSIKNLEKNKTCTNYDKLSQEESIAYEEKMIF